MIVWTWTAVAVFGTGVCLWALIDTYVDRRELRRQPVIDGGARLIVGMNLRSARASLILHVFFLLLGLIALHSPRQHFVPTLGAYGAAYILVAATNARAIALNQVDRVRARRFEQAERKITSAPSDSTHIEENRP